MRFHKKSPLSPLQCIYVVVKRSTEPETGQCCCRQRHHHLTSTATRWRRPHIILYVVVGSKGGREGLEISMTLRTMFFANISLCYNIIGCCIHNSNTDLLNYTRLHPPQTTTTTTPSWSSPTHDDKDDADEEWTRLSSFCY